MTTPATTTTAPSVSNSFLQNVLTDVEHFFSWVGQTVTAWAESSEGQQITTALATVAGTVSADALLSKSSNPAQLGLDVETLGNVAMSLVSSTNKPTLAEMQSAFSALKSNSATSQFAPLAQAFALGLNAFLGTNDGGQSGTGQWQPIAQAYVQGMITAAQAYAGATATTTTTAA